MATKRDYYEVLGVTKSASQVEMKKAYRKMARQYHPDVNRDDQDAEVRFKEIQEAYSVLSDEDKRYQYDTYGHEGLNGQGFDFSGMEFNGFGDIFDMFFGGRAGGVRNRGPVRGDDLRYDLSIDFEEGCFGVEKDIEIMRVARCKACEGTGAKPGSEVETCSTCQGSGQETVYQQTPFGRFQTQRPCQSCQGTGKVIKEPCAACKGKGRIKEKKTVHLNIPGGVQDGSRLRVGAEGDAGFDGGPAGDLYVFLNVRPHPSFTRDRDHIHSRVTLDFVQAALGDTLTVDTLDGDFELKVPAASQYGDTLVEKKKGAKKLRSEGRGDHIFHLDILTPTDLTEEQRSLLANFREGLAPEQVEKKEKADGFFDRIKKHF